MYYVYEWYIKETDEIIYVGKGTKNRYKVRKHNKFFNDMIKRYDCESRIIKTFENEQDAFAYEYERINELKNIGQCVCNIREGGYGGTDKWWTDELRKKYSENNAMKSKNQRKRMKESNPMYDKNISSKVAKKKSRPVIINNKRYDSVKEVMEKYNICYEVVASWCKKGINPFGEKCRFEDSKQIDFHGKRYNIGSCKSMTYLGKSYECPLDCSEDLGIPLSTLYANLKRGFDIKGNPCRYDSDIRELVFENPFKGKHATPIIVNGKRYESVQKAAEELGVAKTTLYAYLQGRRKTDKYICIYDNQQPSHGKTDKSTMEGSTTNG